MIIASGNLAIRMGRLSGGEGKSKRETEALLAKIDPESVRRDFERDIDGDLVELRITIPKRVAEKLARVRARASHKQLQNYAELLENLAESFLKEPTPPAEQPVQKNSQARSAEAKVERYVRARAGDCCDFRDEKTGKRCGSTFFTQVDHIVPYSQGGATIPENLQLLCGAHNRLKWALTAADGPGGGPSRRTRGSGRFLA